MVDGSRRFLARSIDVGRGNVELGEWDITALPRKQ